MIYHTVNHKDMILVLKMLSPVEKNTIFSLLNVWYTLDTELFFMNNM